MSRTKLTRQERAQLLAADEDAPSRRRRLGIGAGVATVASAAALLLLHSEDVKPVDVSKLPRDQVTRVEVTAGGSHYPSGLAGDVINSNTDLGQVTQEIEAEVSGADVVPTGTVLKLPTNQIDPAAVKQYEHGQNGQ